MSALAKITRAFVLGFAVVAVAVAAGVPAAAAAPNVSSLRDAPATARCGADVEFGLIEATGCLESAGNGVWHSTGQVFLNGVELPLSAATALTLTEPAPGTTGGGNLKVSLLAPLEAARVAWTPNRRLGARPPPVAARIRALGVGVSRHRPGRGD